MAAGCCCHQYQLHLFPNHTLHELSTALTDASSYVVPNSSARLLSKLRPDAPPPLRCREVAGGTNRVKQVLAAFRDAGVKLHQAQFLGRPGGCLHALFDVEAAVRRDPKAAAQVGIPLCCRTCCGAHAVGLM